MPLIAGVNFRFTNTDSLPCYGEECEHYAVACLVPKDHIRGSYQWYCWRHLLLANKQIHGSEKARIRWL